MIYELRLDADCPPAVADPDLIKGMLTNLLENAAQAAQPGGEVMAVTSRNWLDRLNIEVTIRARA